MKVLHVGKYFWPFHGGLENYMRDLMTALGRRNIESAALVHRQEKSLTSQDELLGLGGQQLRVVRTGVWMKILFTPISPSFPWHLRRLIRDASPDILHLHMPNPSVFWCLMLPSARRIPWLVHWHADVITASQGWLMRAAYAVYSPLERAVLKKAAAVIATSAPYLDTSEALKPWRFKCYVVPLGMDASRLPAVKRSQGMAAPAQPELRVLAVGRLTYYKGFRYLIEAAAAEENVRVDLVGEGDEARELRALATSLNLHQRVTFHGHANEGSLAQLMADCDCLCLPSVERTEAFGLVLLEAMRFGKATVVSDVPGSGMGWIVDHGITGIKVKPGDSDALAGAFRELAADREGLSRMGEHGKEKFEKMFEINRSVEGVITIYEAVLADRAVPHPTERPQ